MMTGFLVPAANRAEVLPTRAVVPIPAAAEAYQVAGPTQVVAEAFLHQPVHIRMVESARHPEWHRS